jgi:predicted nucleic acid-binding protein
MPCLIDTNILIDALDPQVPAPIAERIVDAIADDARYSVITRIELLGWRGHTEASRQGTESLLAALVEVPLSQKVVKATIDIRAVLPVKLPDAIIAASALVEGLPLMTRNVGDFKRIPGLTVIDPFRE